MDAYESLVDQLYQNDRQSHLRLIADNLTAVETTPMSHPVITRRQLPSPSSNGVASIRPTQPVYVGRQDDHLHVSPGPSLLDETYATIYSKPALEPRTRPYNDNAFNIEYNGDETLKDTLVFDNWSVSLLSRRQLTKYMSSEHREEHETGMTTITFYEANTARELHVTNQAAYTARKAIHYSNIQPKDQTDEAHVIKDRNIHIPGT
jgi:hypothetical protein